MISKNVRWLVALVVVFALLGAIGLVSADMNTTKADTESHQNHMGTMNGSMYEKMSDHMDEDMMERIQEHMRDHGHGDGHERGTGHC